MVMPWTMGCGQEESIVFRTIAKLHSLDWSCAVLWGIWINDIPFSPTVPRVRPGEIQ